METKVKSKIVDQKKHVRILSLAEKYKCSRQYVSQVLDGTAPANSPLAKKILKDTEDITEIYNRDTKVTI